METRTFSVVTSISMLLALTMAVFSIMVLQSLVFIQAFLCYC